MAKAEADPQTPEIEEVSVQPVRTRSKLLIILAFVAVVLLEMIFLLFLLPQSAVPPVAAPETVESTVPEFSIEAGPTVKPGDWVEFPIPDPFMCMIPSIEGESGGYNISAKFTFKIEKSKESKFTGLYDKVKGDIRDQILTILRSSKVADLTDSANTTIKNRILRKVNEIFGESLVKGVLVENFNATPM